MIRSYLKSWGKSCVSYMDEGFGDVGSDDYRKNKSCIDHSVRLAEKMSSLYLNLVAY